jgi:hypothetical protein
MSLLLALVALGSVAADEPRPVLDKQALLDAQTFWDNRDWDWYKAHIPFFECPDPAITTTYYYRWELVTKHLTYGSPATGYVFTEFIDRPVWSGAYGAISCPAGHQLYEVRWLRDPRFARDYTRYWFQTPGAQPRNYSTWLADALWAVHRAHPDDGFATKLLPDLIRNFEAWERSRFDPKVGLFWQTGHDDGMEYNINSRQTQDILRGAPAFRPTINSYMIADARAIARVAELAGEPATARTYRAKAEALEENLLKKLWDPRRRFFFPMALRDEHRDGFTVKAGSLTHQTGKFAGDPHGRELIGYTPWQFNIPRPGFEAAWPPLMDRDAFFVDFGPTVVERHDPMFLVTNTCCWWSGQSWPYATTQTLKALATLIQDNPRPLLSKDDYFKLLSAYTRTHRKAGRPYIAEGANPDTGSWEGYDSPNHSEHYFHSGYNDLIITGLAGLRPTDDDTIDLRSLAPDDWDYFALDDVPYRGRSLTILWDRDGRRYGRGKGLRVLADGREIARADALVPLTATLPPITPKPEPGPRPVNVAVNNHGSYYPRASASFSGTGTMVAKAIDGNFYYHKRPSNRWTCEGSSNKEDWFAIDFGTPRKVDTIKLYFLDDGDHITAPSRYELEAWDGSKWVAIPGQARSPGEPIGHRANVARFPELTTTKVRAVLTHRTGSKSGLSEFEAWGDGSQAITPAPPPTGNLAYNPGDRPFPRASASFTSRFDKVERVNDGRVAFAPNPPNRWTSFESPNAEDWLEIDLGAPKAVARVELAIYDDRGGVQAPADYRVETWDNSSWQPAPNQRKTPEEPVGGQLNEVRFDRVTTSKVRVVFIHRSRARSGLTEILIWPD